MDKPVLQKQTIEQPLFPDLLWARPERKDQAGKLLIIGGSTHGFASLVKNYEYALKAGIGEAKVVLPKGVEKLIGALPDTIYAPQVDNGSFAHGALQEIQPYLSWADALLLPGELTNNAETTLLIEDILRVGHIPIIIAGDAIEIVTKTLSEPLQTKPIVIATFRQLQRLTFTHSGKQPLLSSSSLDQQAGIMQSLVATLGIRALARHDEGQMLVVSPDAASLTLSTKPTAEFTAHAAVLAAQFPTKLFEAATTAAVLSSSN